MLDVLDSEYVRFARVKGLSEELVVYKHALKNAVVPALTMGGLMVAGQLNGSVLAEIIFAWPGIGAPGGQRHRFERLCRCPGHCLGHRCTIHSLFPDRGRTLRLRKPQSQVRLILQPLEDDGYQPPLVIPAKAGIHKSKSDCYCQNHLDFWY